MSHRVLPDLRLLAEAAALLPPAEHWADPYFELAPQPGGLPLTFRRIRVRDLDGAAYRWVYEGKVLVSPATDVSGD